MKYLSLILLLLALVSCKNETQQKASVVSKPKDSLKTEYPEKEEDVEPKKVVQINFEKNKDLLDIILLLPNSCFSSWEWSLESRTKLYNEIKTNNYHINEEPRFLDLKYFEPNKAGFTVVDGFWSINLYKTAENSYIVVTDDIVGDGNNLKFYEVKGNKLKEYSNEKLMFPDYKELLKKKDTDEDCTESFEVFEDPIFQFDFSTNNKIEIEASWTLTEESYKNCLIGNAIVYNFNPNTKKFEVELIYWRPKQEN